ncbi:MAG: sugar phosphate isomerase/epimerase, partial [Cyclobacteriaceae bacterium]
IEMCSPLGYQGSGFGPLHKYKGRELKELFLNEGIKCTSSHFTFGELKDHLEDRIAWSKDLGIEQMILSTFWLPEDERTPDNYRKAASELNRIAQITNESGLQMGFHNHHQEFNTVNGQLIYEVLLDEFDPDLVKMQFQVAVVNIGYQAADYFRKFPGRFISAHLSDWSAARKEQVPIGQGEVDWKDFFDAAKAGGVENIYVEMDPATFAASARYLSGL